MLCWYRMRRQQWRKVFCGSPDVGAFGQSRAGRECSHRAAHPRRLPSPPVGLQRSNRRAPPSPQVRASCIGVPHLSCCLNPKSQVLSPFLFLRSPSILLAHEVAYAIGQTQNAYAVDKLTQTMLDESYHPVVRHECAEGLGPCFFHPIFWV